ncbi:MrpH family fimbial adhesin [Metapseudomonas boanensis]|uniref:Fimbrial adhesin MrpH C-terminal domain-containing protein n=1 Tax=Metapseudomonas boanensis TaxID=2822138 RepID=A0ABS5XNW4_9GAMM|nr:hypothetical protein [Pseudomonas boanensis]MBT8769305.1 hypothetical protein [Pseudomonas boanensis]
MRSIILALKRFMLLLCLLMCVEFPALAYGAATGKGGGIFESTWFSDFQWHIEYDGSVIIDKAALNDRGIGPYPCEQAWKKAAPGLGKFESCTLVRIVNASPVVNGRLLQTSNIKGLTLTQLKSQLTITGKIATVRPASTGDICFLLEIQGAHGMDGHYLPASCSTGPGGGGGIPGAPPEPELSCSLYGSIDLRHGNVTPESVNGHTASTTVYVTCSKSATVKLAVTPGTQGSLKLTGVSGLTSSLYADGVGGGRSLSISAGTSYTAVTIKSVLKADGAVSVGSFKGSTYAVLSIP